MPLGRQRAIDLVEVERGVEGIEEPLDDSAPQLQLGVEVVVDLWLVCAGALGDGPRRCRLEADGGELELGSVEQSIGNLALWPPSARTALLDRHETEG